MKLDLQHNLKKYKRPFLIAGPCSVESEEQMMQVAQDLSELQPALIRGGIWKPRTRPNSFEGIGAIGLPWLVNAGKEVGVPVTTEVANAIHVEAALKAGVDVLWIGARTAVNPFAVQEIADAVQGTDITVMIKNPINPDLMLWIGAFERFQKAGINDLIAIHRGFSVYKHPRYRNVPNWEIPIGLTEEMPEIPLICDPSHISGRRDGLFPIAQKAMDLNFAGLMIETHNNPDKAWSDAQQQITPNQLKELLDQLVLRKADIHVEGLDFIGIQRKKIEEIDNQLFNLLKERMEIVRDIGEYKKEKNITILQSEHWKKMIEQRLAQAEQLELSIDFLRSVLDAIHQESIRHQTKVMNP
ncbi:bifunctional 3-deoxy-7-phosphoheptulonate synthase/chorismate mutase type II [Brumimicrobium aurantiacum]|uniref:chorismate mutase n=1 Tax=Brumimicrobium aurantiacum TaxID=1737063 RepID=A0A3E1EZ26_9FLAO|nr:bifunctional 3-deoxy-7-phosphoheptulonate synthase/chorismate mutase type II [Brumimicrobium aurantiacum]RFC54798.1 3-deoxy-7-phosphoheptulonate synthase [Brumimicrobium aurantiacum]